MFAFAVIMGAGLAGMVMMALPGLSHRGHVTPHGVAHLGHGASAGHAGHTVHGAGHTAGSNAGRGGSLLGMIPSPRVVFSIMTLFGAFGYALAAIWPLSPLYAALLALIPTVLVERLAVTPLWNLLFRFEGTPSTPLVNLVCGEATAVTAFHNGRGIVRVEHDGRSVQIRAELSGSHMALPVHVGDALFIENVDVPNERVTVSVK